MKMCEFGTFLNGIILFILAVGLVAGCNERRIERCVKDFTRGAGDRPARTESQINRNCNWYYPKLKSCLKIYTSGCPQEVRSGYQGFKNFYDFVCTEGKRDAIKFAECLSNIPAQLECEEDLIVDFKIGTQSKEEKCKYIDEYLLCKKHAVEVKCGSESARFHEITVRLAEGPRIALLGCGKLFVDLRYDVDFASSSDAPVFPVLTEMCLLDVNCIETGIRPRKTLHYKITRLKSDTSTNYRNLGNELPCSLQYCLLSEQIETLFLRPTNSNFNKGGPCALFFPPKIVSITTSHLRDNQVLTIHYKRGVSIVF